MNLSFPNSALVVTMLYLLLAYDSSSGQSVPAARFEIGVGFVHHARQLPAHAPTSMDSLPPALWDDLADFGISMPHFRVNEPRAEYISALLIRRGCGE